MVYTDGGTSAYVTDNPNDLIGAYRALPLYTAPSPRKGAGMTELNSDRTVAVDREYYWRGMETCPRGVKVQLLGRGGVAVYGQYRGKEDWWMAWAPLPTLRPEDKKKWSAGK